MADSGSHYSSQRRVNHMQDAMSPPPTTSTSSTTQRTFDVHEPAAGDDDSDSIFVREPSLASLSLASNDEKHGHIRPRDLLPDFRNIGHQHHGIQTELGTCNAQDIIHALQLAQQKPTDIELKQPDVTDQTSPPQQRIPEWYRVGWTAFSEMENPGGSLNILATEHQPLNDVDAAFDFVWHSLWLQQTGAIFVIGITAWLLARVGGGWIVFLLLLTFIITYYYRSVTRFRLSTGDDIKRNLCSNFHVDQEAEKVEWLNSFLHNFWLIFEPVLSAYVVENLDTYLVDYLPSFLDSVRLTTFTLGNKPFKVDSVRMLDAQANVVCMDWIVSFEPNDTIGMTKKELEDQVSPKVQLQIRLGKGFVGAAFPVLVENMSFHGHLRIKIQFISKFPHIKIVEACFMEKPEFDYVLKPLGGDTIGFDVNKIPGLQGFVREQAHAILGPMFYYPNVFSYDIEKFFSGELDISQANGVLAVTVYSASSVKASDVPGGHGNMSLRFYLDKAQELARTSTAHNSLEPAWNETHFLLLNNLNAKLTLELRNESGNALKDSRVARGHFDLNELLEEEDYAAEGVDMDLLRKGRRITSCHVDMKYLPVSKPTELDDGTIEPAVDSNSGVLRFTVHECRNLRSGKSIPNPYAIVKVNGVEKIKTPTFKRTDTPKFERSGEVVVLDRTQVKVTVTMMNSVDFAEDVCLGTWSSDLVSIMQDQAKNGCWWDLQSVSPSSGPSRPRIRFSVQWKPVDMSSLITASSLSGASHYREPIGMVRLSLWEARDLLNVEGVTGGKSDPYVRVMAGSQSRARTQVIENNLFPEWGEFHYVPIHHMRDNLVMEVMDWNAKTKDKLLGSATLRIRDLVKEHRLAKDKTTHQPEVKWYSQLAKIDKWVPLKSPNGKTNKGELRYTAEFYPGLALPPSVNQQPAIVTQCDANTTENSPDKKSGLATDCESSAPADMTPTTTTSLTATDLHGLAIKWTPDGFVDLKSYSSGVLMVRIHEVEMARPVHAYCSVLVDSLYSQYRTVGLKGKSLLFNEAADAFVKEADFSKLYIEVKPFTSDNDKNEEKYGYWSGSVNDVMRLVQHHNRTRQTSAFQDTEQTDEGQWLDLSDTSADLPGRIRLSFAYFPLADFELNPDESLENQGNLTVTLLEAKDVMALDKSGTSDPYVVFTVNGDRVHRSAVVKKSLNPVWKNEQFTIPVLSRVTASFRIEVFDWNQFKGDYPMGSGGISLRNEYVESFLARDVRIPLDGIAGVSGYVRVRFLWQPQLLTTKKTQTASMLQTMRTMTYRNPPPTSTTINNAISSPLISSPTNPSHSPISAKSPDPASPKSPQTVESVTSDNHLELPSPANHHDTPRQSEDLVTMHPRHSVSSVSTTSSHHHGISSLTSPSTASLTPSLLSVSRHHAQALGIVTVHLIAARGLLGVDKGGTSDPFVQVRIGHRSMHKTKVIKKSLAPEWNESFQFKLPKQEFVLEYRVKDYNRFSHSVKLGTYLQDFSSLDELYTNHSLDLWAKLQPQGELHLKLLYEPL
ncbi:hypothetical protein DM01DRAFT_1336589 [Hesseltinella vesiculosa]|uniref:Tricalbin n=1 Tax=Hesseltinella vesiculosa TaxID=101127 RepID=A0A1X2GG02_9FUNG|nr:hypothetical protein DM01DRAFT_1336589 [Hesseltinella vesiculosa]